MQLFQSACGDAPSDAFWRGTIQSAARTGRFSVEAGTRAAAPFPAPLSPLAAPFLRCAPDRFLLSKPKTFQHYREASVAPLRWFRSSSCAASILGHSDLETTLNVYTHVIPESQRRAWSE